MDTPEQLRRDHCQHQPHRKCQRRRDDHHKPETVAREQPRQRAGPGEFGPCFGPPFGQRQRHIHGEFMGRRILAGMVAGPAMVTEIGQLRGVALREQAAALHRREDSAEALAIAAGIADLHDPRGFLMRRRGGELDQADIIHGVCPRAGGSGCGRHRLRRFGRTQPRWSCRFRRDNPGRGHCLP